MAAGNEEQDNVDVRLGPGTLREHPKETPNLQQNRPRCAIIQTARL